MAAAGAAGGRPPFAHACLTAAAGCSPPAAGLGGLAGARRAGPAVPQHHQRAVPGRVALRAWATCGARAMRAATETSRRAFLFTNAPEATFTGCLLLFLAAMTLVTRQPALRAALGGGRGHHPGQRAADLLPPPAPLAGGDLEVPADLLGRHRAGAARQLLPGRRRAPARRRRAHRRWSWTTCSPRGASLHSPGSRRRSCCSSSATAPRWGWRRCTPGCPTRTARRRRWSRRCSRARCSTAPSWASSASSRSAPRRARRRSARSCCVGFGLLSMAVAAVFILGQTDYKRMLAYSSVEHMGILALASASAARRPSAPCSTRSTTR